MRNPGTYRLISAPILAVLALLFFGATTITAAPGDLDPTFGNGGIAMANRGNNPIVQLYSASAMAIQVPSLSRRRHGFDSRTGRQRS
jgi:hypothetical protein